MVHVAARTADRVAVQSREPPGDAGAERLVRCRLRPETTSDRLEQFEQVALDHNPPLAVRVAKSKGGIGQQAQKLRCGLGFAPSRQGKHPWWPIPAHPTKQCGWPGCPVAGATAPRATFPLRRPIRHRVARRVQGQNRAPAGKPRRGQPPSAGHPPSGTECRLCYGRNLWKSSRSPPLPVREETSNRSGGLLSAIGSIRWSARDREASRPAELTRFRSGLAVQP